MLFSVKLSSCLVLNNKEFIDPTNTYLERAMFAGSVKPSGLLNSLGGFEKRQAIWSISFAIAKSFISRHRLPTICKPMGKPFWVCPTGITTAGYPLKLKGMVSAPIHNAGVRPTRNINGTPGRTMGEGGSNSPTIFMPIQSALPPYEPEPPSVEGKQISCHLQLGLFEPLRLSFQRQPRPSLGQP